MVCKTLRTILTTTLLVAAQEVVEVLPLGLSGLLVSDFFPNLASGQGRDIGDGKI